MRSSAVSRHEANSAIQPVNRKAKASLAPFQALWSSLFALCVSLRVAIEERTCRILTRRRRWRSSSIKSLAVSQAVMWFDWFTLKIPSQTNSDPHVLPSTALIMRLEMRSRQRRRCIDGIDGVKERGKRGGGNNVATAAAATCLDFEMHLLSLTRTAEPVLEEWAAKTVAETEIDASPMMKWIIYKVHWKTIQFYFSFGILLKLHYNLQKCIIHINLLLILS